MPRILVTCLENTVLISSLGMPWSKTHSHGLWWVLPWPIKKFLCNANAFNDESTSLFIIPPASTKLIGGYTGITLSVRPSVRLSICGQNRVRSVSSTILIGSISYLHILSSNLRKCVACNASFKIKKIQNFGEFFKFVTLTLFSFDLGSNMTQWYG